MAFNCKINKNETDYIIVCAECFTETEIKVKDSNIVLTKDNPSLYEKVEKQVIR